MDNTCTWHGALWRLGLRVRPHRNTSLFRSDPSLRRAFTRPNVPQIAYPEGFQGNAIPLSAAVVSRIVVDRLNLAEELDEA